MSLIARWPDWRLTLRLLMPLRLARLLTHPELAARGDSGREVLSDAAAEAEAKRALAAVATDLHASLGHGDVAASVQGDADVASVMEAFVDEIMKILVQEKANFQNYA